MQEITICNQSKGSKFLSQIPMMNFKPGLQQEGFVAIQTKESPRMKACIKVLFYLFRCFLRFSTRISNVPTSYLVSFYCRNSNQISFLLKVSKFRKQIDLFSFEPKTERNISALRFDQ